MLGVVNDCYFCYGAESEEIEHFVSRQLLFRDAKTNARLCMRMHKIFRFTLLLRTANEVHAQLFRTTTTCTLFDFYSTFMFFVLLENLSQCSGDTILFKKA